jgi:uncharacterized protein
VDKVDNTAKRSLFEQSRPVIGLFAKQPVPGQVKTRLTPPLKPDQACRLYQTALQETLAILCSSGVPVTLCYAGEHRWFRQNFPGQTLLAQVGEDLGTRMTRAVEELFAVGFGPVLLAGSDSPDLPASRVVDVLAHLAETDVVTVPSDDGGYAVIGLRRPTTAVFATIPWSTAGVQDAIRLRCRQLGLSYAETASWYDLDDMEDLRRLVTRSPASRTARQIASELSALL